jgi:hypothetical protein
MNPVHPAFGSSANITHHSNRLTSQRFDSLKTYWIWPGLQRLETSRPFLSRFLSLVDMGSFIESRALADYVTRIPLVQRRPHLFMRETKGGYVIAELIEFLRGTERGSIHAGAMFTQYVVAAFIVRVLTIPFLGSFFIKKYRLNSPCCVAFWRSLQAQSSWLLHSTGGVDSME